MLQELKLRQLNNNQNSRQYSKTRNTQTLHIFVHNKRYQINVASKFLLLKLIILEDLPHHYLLMRILRIINGLVKLTRLAQERHLLIWDITHLREHLLLTVETSDVIVKLNVLILCHLITRLISLGRMVLHSSVVSAGLFSPVFNTIPPPSINCLSWCRDRKFGA